MANIKNMQMWNSICADARISICKTLFGLRTTATFSPTNSVIDANTFEYSPADGERLKRLLETPREKAVQLHQFTRMSYEPVTDVLLFEGDDARMMKQLF